MKKLMILAVFAIVLAAFNGCQNDDTEFNSDYEKSIPNKELFAGLDSIGFSVDNNRIVFKSEEEYNKCLGFLAQLGDKNFSAFEKWIGFNSYRSKFEKDSVKSELFVDPMYQAILNPEMEIVIGNYLFKENPVEKKTLAFQLPVDGACNLKSANILSDPIQFSWDDEVFAILDGELQLKGSKPSCTSGNKQNKRWILESKYTDLVLYDYHLVALDAKLVFQVTGIFKSIISKLKADYWKNELKDTINPTLPILIEAKMDITGKYDRNDESPRIINEHHYEVFNSQFDEISWRPFYGSRRVRCYSMHSTFSYKILQGAITPYSDGDSDQSTCSMYCNTYVSDCN